MSRRESVEVPYSIFREEVIKKLKQLHYIGDYKTEGDVIKIMTVQLVYRDKMPTFSEVKIYSRPGSRIYVKAHSLTPVLGGYGYAFLTTPKGVMTHVEAKKANLGGELLFAIW